MSSQIPKGKQRALGKKANNQNNFFINQRIKKSKEYHVPWIPIEANHNGRKGAFLSWTLSAEQAEMPHYGQNNKAQQSLLLE